jgi:hypothetical protein
MVHGRRTLSPGTPITVVAAHRIGAKTVSSPPRSRHDERMTARRSVRFSAAIVLLAVGAAAGCGDDEPTTEEATTEVCDARDSLDDTITDVSNLDPSDTADLDEARDELSDDVDELADAGRQLAESEWDDLEGAVDNLRDTVGSIGGDTTFSEAAEQLSGARDELVNAWDSFIAQVSC